MLILSFIWFTSKWNLSKHGIGYVIHLLIVDALSSSTKSSFSFLSSFLQNFILLTHLFILSFLFFSLAKRLWWSFLNGLVGILSELVGSEEHDSVRNIEDALSTTEVSWSLKSFFCNYSIIFFYHSSSWLKLYSTFYISRISDAQS